MVGRVVAIARQMRGVEDNATVNSELYSNYNRPTAVGVAS